MVSFGLNFRRKNRAFTLVELLVVIAIIALLLSIMMPALNRAKEQGRKVKCGSNMRQIGIGLQVYSASNNGTIPPWYFPVQGTLRPLTSFGHQVIGSYPAPFGRTPVGLGILAEGSGAILKGRDMFFCPSDRYFPPQREKTSSGLGWANFKLYYPTTPYYNHMSYYYLYVSKGGWDSNGRQNYRKYERYNTSSPSKSAIAMDPGRDDQWGKLYEPVAGFHKPIGWNSLYMDGHVSWGKALMASDIVRIQRDISPNDYWSVVLNYLDGR